jgi:hypothetical protein
MNNNVSIICIAVAVVIAGFVNMQQDIKIKALTERVYQLEQTK